MGCGTKNQEGRPGWPSECTATAREGSKDLVHVQEPALMSTNCTIYYGVKLVGSQRRLEHGTLFAINSPLVQNPKQQFCNSTTDGMHVYHVQPRVCVWFLFQAGWRRLRLLHVLFARLSWCASSLLDGSTPRAGSVVERHSVGGVITASIFFIAAIAMFFTGPAVVSTNLRSVLTNLANRWW